MAYPSRRNDFRATAVRLIHHAGQDCVYRKATPGVYDTTTGTVTETVKVYPAFKAYVSNLTDAEARNPSLVDARAVELWIAYTDLPEEPLIGSTLEVASIQYEILRVKSHSYHAGPAVWVAISKRS